MKNLLVLSKDQMKKVSGGVARNCDVYYILPGGGRKNIMSFDEDSPGANSAHDEATFWAIESGKRVGYDCEGV
ncbi:hypothetical protein [Pedobacter nototheniae]|uniref:hypothetical protein n=1 Tax=Pedobacter nototheniae TaxID=2488994 RepID=UPI0029303218|nr:hypothetical protein [Pedobacter nototheniae]